MAGLSAACFSCSSQCRSFTGCCWLCMHFLCCMQVAWSLCVLSWLVDIYSARVISYHSFALRGISSSDDLLSWLAVVN